MHDPGSVCPGCGGTRFAKLGEDVTEVLEKIPARLKVIRHIRPKLSCRCCERIVQAPMPDLPIAKGRPGPGLVANVVINKYLDGLPLYRQSAILAREGIEIERATLADWVGHAAWWVTPLAELIGAHVLAAPIIHTDDTPIAVLAPGNGKTRTGRLWTYVVDERPWQGGRAPAAYYRFSPDRRGERPRDHLARFRGVIQADAFSGYDALTRPICQRPGGRGAAADPCGVFGPRQAKILRRVRVNQVADRRRGAQTDWRALQDRSRDYWPEGRKPTGDATEPCRGDPRRLARLADRQRRRLSAKNALAKAIQYALSRWEALSRYAGDGRLAIDNNLAERALRGIAVTRKNFLFLGSEAGGERAAILYTVLESAKLNGLDPKPSSAM